MATVSWSVLAAVALQVPPVAKRVPHAVHFGAAGSKDRLTLNDDLFWLRDDTRSSHEVLELLRKENEYSQSRTAHLAPLREELYQEMLSHLQEEFDQFPSPAADGYEYWSRTVAGRPFRLHLRRLRGSPMAKEEVVLDINAVAATLPKEQQAQCGVAQVLPSPSGRLLAYTVDGTGGETYEVRLQRLQCGRGDGGGGDGDGGGGALETLQGTAGSLAWLDEATLFYVRHDSTHRPSQVWRHTVGSPQEEDTLVHEEEDPLFAVRCWATRDGSLLLIASESKETSEVRYVQQGDAAAGRPPRLVRRRAFGHSYEVDSHSPSRSLLLLTNEHGAVNSELRLASLDAPSVWRPLEVAAAATAQGESPVLAHAAGRSLDAVFVFDTHLAVTGREGGASQVWVAPLQLAGGDAAGGDGEKLIAGSVRRLEFDEAEGYAAQAWG
jgi:oligopeptidase B